MIKIHASSDWQAEAPQALTAARQAHACGDLDETALAAIACELRTQRWRHQQAQGLDYVTVGDLPAIGRMAAMGRLFGLATPQPAVDASTSVNLHADALLAEVDAAIALPASPKVSLLGPVSWLYLGRSTEPGFDRLTLLNRLLPAYERLLTLLAARGVTWVQLEEPVLGHALPPAWQGALHHAYAYLRGADPQLLLGAGAAPLNANLGLACELPVAGLHVDTRLASRELHEVARRLPLDRELSVGLLGHGDVAAALAALREIRQLRGGRLWLAAPCQPGNAGGASDMGAIQRSLWLDDAVLVRGIAKAHAARAHPSWNPG